MQPERGLGTTIRCNVHSNSSAPVQEHSSSTPRPVYHRHPLTGNVVAPQSHPRFMNSAGGCDCWSQLRHSDPGARKPRAARSVRANSRFGTTPNASHLLSCEGFRSELTCLVHLKQVRSFLRREFVRSAFPLCPRGRPAFRIRTLFQREDGQTSISERSTWRHRRSSCPIRHLDLTSLHEKIRLT